MYTDFDDSQGAGRKSCTIEECMSYLYSNISFHIFPLYLDMITTGNNHTFLCYHQSDHDEQPAALPAIVSHLSWRSRSGIRPNILTVIIRIELSSARLLLSLILSNTLFSAINEIL